MKRKINDNDNNTETSADNFEEVSIRRRINFDADSDEEIIFDTQAHKKRKMTKDMEELKVWFDKKMEDQTKQIVDSINVNTERGLRNEKDIVQLKGAISRIEQAIALPTQLGRSTQDNVTYASTAAMVPPASLNLTTAQSRLPQDRENFLLSRRRLRLWPIEGDSPKQLNESVIAFCCQALGAPRRDELGIEKVTRVKSAPRGVAHMEVVVDFVDNYARDDILMRGPMLSEYRDSTNKPTAGIRLDIPSHLMGIFKTLESFGFALKRRYGEKLKKHIKFDEFDHTLYIQVGLKEESETNWTDYSAEEARNGL